MRVSLMTLEEDRRGEVLSRMRFRRLSIYTHTLATASISSMKTMAGASFLALAKSSLTRCAPIPTYSSTNSDAAILKNGTFASPATALITEGRITRED